MRKILEDFAKVKILIVGDAMIDRYCWGSVSRISPEAPVPIVRLEKSSALPGGAANVAANVAGLGASPYLISVIGDDAGGKSLPHILAAAKVSADFLYTLAGRQTTVKTRIVAHQQHVVRLDSETRLSLTAKQEERVFEKYTELTARAAVLVISDYGKGLLSKKLTERLITSAKTAGKIVIVDPKGTDFGRYKNASVLTPNKAEAAAAAHGEVSGRDSFLRAGKKLLGKLALGALLVTEGENGMTLFEDGKPPEHFPAVARSAYDVTGAGDTVVAVLAVALGAGATLKQAAELANTAAGLAVEEIGTTVVNFEKLKTRFGSRPAKT